MRERKWVAALLVAAGAFLALAIWVLRTPSVERSGAPAVPEVASEENPRTGPDRPPESPAGRTVAAAPAPASPVASGGPPASYLRWLGRVTGRVLDWDGAPVPDLSVDAYVADLISLVPAASALFGENSYRPRILDA